MKNREIACIHYKFEGKNGCDLGKECSFYGHCQTCKTYKAIPGGQPARKDLRKEKINKIINKEMKNEY